MSKPPAPTASPLVRDEDRRLIEACVAGSGQGWEAFIDRFAGLFASVATATARHGGQTLSATDREDFAADILLACLANRGAVLRAFGGRASLETYLTVIARRVSVRRLRQGMAPLPHKLASECSPAGGPSPSPGTRLDDREQVESLLGQLDRDEARLVRLHHLEARSYGEISRVTGLPLGSIGPALSRARAKLRQLAAEHDQP